MVINNNQGSLADRVNVLGVPVSTYDKEQLLNFVYSSIEEDKKVLVGSGNVYSCNLAYESLWLRQFYKSIDVVRLDGSGVRLGAKFLGYDLPNRITWADFAWDLAAFCSKYRYALFFLGARPGTAERAAERLKDKYPELCIAGIHHGYFNKDPRSPENESIIKEINTSDSQILIVGFGMPLQELWLTQNWVNLNINVTLTGGAVFDYISGELGRSPSWMTNNGLEWLGRFLLEPQRLWRRYFIGNPLFFYRVFRQRIGMIDID